MSEYLKKYTSVGTRILAAFLHEAVDATLKQNAIDDCEKDDMAEAECLAACLVSLRKEDRASVSVSLTHTERDKRFTALCEKDGRVRGCLDDVTKGVIKEGVILEVTQRLQVRGDYTSVVTAANTEEAVREYFRISQQTRAKCLMKKLKDGYVCLLAEMFPITELKHEIYADDADEVFAALDKLKETATSEEDVLAFLSAYKEEEDGFALVFGCTCTKRSVRAALAGVDTGSLDDILDENGCIEVRCKHCGKTYHIEV